MLPTTWIDTPQSTSIIRFGYDGTSQELLVEFHDERKYKYLKVPPAVFEQLKSASSKGQFVNHDIKGIYEHEEVR
jgi:hypothetical protein